MKACCQYMGRGRSYETDWVDIVLAVIKITLLHHITLLCFLLHTLIKDKCMGLQDE